MLTKEQILEQHKEHGLVWIKYICTPDGYLFVDAADTHCVTHENMANPPGGQPKYVLSAGYFQIRGNELSVGGWSTTLNASPSSEDYVLLPQMFGMIEGDNYVG